ncbi:MAG: PhoH family protein [Fidelibacterota bacterium]
MSQSIKETKLFILDTNVILHDSECLYHFQDNDVVIPIAVIEELDKFKRGNEQVHYNAREFLRQLDKLSCADPEKDETSLGENQGTVRVVVNHNWHPDVEASFQEDNADNRIINCAFKLKEDHSNREVVLISKDTNMRLKARSLNLIAEDYTTDKVESIEKIYTGVRLIEDISGEAIDQLYSNQGFIDPGLTKMIKSPIANENFILRNGHKSGLATYSPKEEHFVRVDKVNAYGISPRNAEQSFSLKALIDPAIQIITITGKAGTGKTLLALASALEQRSKYRQIYLARPIVPLSNRDLGFLPGDIQSKIDPYMKPLFDNLSFIKHQFNKKDNRTTKIDEMLENDKLVITPLAYIRGRSFQNVFFIVDEAQNLTPHEIKTIITRAGEGTKFVFTGDIYQIDQPYLDSLSNGLSYLIHRFTDQPMYTHVTLQKGERSPLAELASDLL